jgi:hypothetical protein
MLAVWNSEVEPTVVMAVRKGELSRPLLMLSVGGNSVEPRAVTVRLPKSVRPVYAACDADVSERFNSDFIEVTLEDVSWGDRLDIVAHVPVGLDGLDLRIWWDGCMAAVSCRVEFDGTGIPNVGHHLRVRGEMDCVEEVCAREFGGHTVRRMVVPTQSAFNRAQRTDKIIPRWYS